MRIGTVRPVAAMLALPGLAAGAGWLFRRAWAPRLPGSVAIHWGPEGVDRGADLDVLTAWTLGATGVLAVASAVLAIAGIRRGYGVRRPVVAFAAWLATMPAACLIASLQATLDVPSWHQAAGAGGVIAIVLGVSGAAGALAAVVAGPGTAPERPAGAAPEGPSLGLAPGERAAWVGRTTNVGLAVLLALLVPAIALATILLTAAGPALAAYLAIGAVSVLVALALARISVVVDSTGVTIRMGAFGLPRRHVPLGDIADARVEQLGVLSGGGFGVRVNPVSGYTAYKIRTGPALALHLRSGYRILATVDRPEQAAGLVNDLVRRESTGRA
ncbi:DUF1648 domain-containing protein [Prauserella muralis]|uniref:Uncharacterized protein n=1 Tax=Prauserella muralis TaxID=588067 RepID=A0A2V4BAP9_9PSEU|nr:DUF1648 domain-containing protein [Prauserella muralis]PXY32151.1 hypothetical protein BAY60_07615 [Prauserella muralis]TWE24195.1 hypothetical protein FHX69_5505 [Prauserella muralis]